MLDLRLYMAQRLSALLMAPLVIGHIAVMIYAVQGGLSAGEILGRTRGSLFWALFYGGFVVAVSIHAAIGLRTDHLRMDNPSRHPAERAVMGASSASSCHGRTCRSGRHNGMSISRARPVRGRHALWYAHILHRVSGVALALFLPLHFWVLSLALTDAARLDGFLAFTELPFVKLAEFGLVFLLAVHMFGGLRLMALEWLPWPAPHKTLAAGTLALSAFLSGIFFLQAI